MCKGGLSVASEARPSDAAADAGALVLPDQRTARAACARAAGEVKAAGALSDSAIVACTPNAGCAGERPLAVSGDG